MPDVPTIEPSDRLLADTDTIVDDATTREADGLAGSSLAAAMSIVTSTGETTVNAGTAGRHDRPPFVNVAPVTPIQTAAGRATEDYGRRDQVHQISVFRASAANAVADRSSIVAAFAADGHDRWALVAADVQPFEDDTLHPPAWVAPFTIRDLHA